MPSAVHSKPDSLRIFHAELVTAKVRGVEHEASSKQGNRRELQLDEIAASNAKTRTPRFFMCNGIVQTLMSNGMYISHAIMVCRMFGRIAIWPVLTVALATLSMAVAQELPEGEGKKLLEERCAGCHSLKPVVTLKQSQDAWKKLVVKMVGYGAQLDDKEVDVATEYLTKHFGPEVRLRPQSRIVRRRR